MSKISISLESKKIANTDFLSSFLRINDSINQLGSEKIKIFQLLGNLTHEEFSFDQYLNGAMALLYHAEKSFIETRSDELLEWLLKKFSLKHKVSSHGKKCFLCIYNHTITFPFKTKEVLSLFIEAKSTSLNVGTIKKIIMKNCEGISFVEGSFISVVNKRDKVTKIHLEIQKEDSFSSKEVFQIEEVVSHSLEDFLKKPQVQFIVPSNRELLIKSFQWIIKDLNRKDLPHVFIDFSKQRSNSFQFSALVCCSRELTENSLQKKLLHSDVHVDGVSSYEEGGYIKEGAVLTIDITANPSFSIIEARKESYLLIQDLIGPFRDVNGGLLEKIEHNFNLFCEKVAAPTEELKSFFYGITPQEKQATASISLLKKVYLSMNQNKLEKEIDYFIQEDKDGVCITIKTIHPKLEKEFRSLLLAQFPTVLIASSYAGDVISVSCALQKNNEDKLDELKSLTFAFYNRWCEKKEIKQVLRLACTTLFSSLDPRIGVQEEPSCFLKMLFEGLTKIGKDGLPKSAIARKVEVIESGLTYRFFLRESYWSNGMRLTAHDFVYSFKTSLRPDFPSPLSYLFYSIVNAQEVKEGKLSSSELGIHAIDDLTLEIKLRYSVSYFLELCAHSAFSPICRAVDFNNPSWPNSLGVGYVCNGPFVLDKTKNKEIVLKKNSFFWEKEDVKLEKVIIYNTTENESKVLFQKKKVDALLFPLCKNKNFENFNVPKACIKKGITEIRYLTFNCLKPPFTNKKMRQAFSLALQRKNLAFSFSDNAKPHYTPHSPELTQLTIDQSEEENKTLAKKLFFEALDEMNLKPSIFNQEKIYTNPHSRGTEKLIVKQLNEVFGIKLSSVVVDMGKLFLLARKRKINIYSYGWIDRIQDRSYLLSTFSSIKDIINYPWWSSGEIKALIQSIHKSSCLKLREKLSYQAEKILHQEKPLIPLLSHSACSFIQSNIHDIQIKNSKIIDIRYCYNK